jgi:hypothetical protein
MAWENKQNSISKIISAKRAGGIIQMADHLQHEVLSSNSSTAIKKKKVVRIYLKTKQITCSMKSLVQTPVQQLKKKRW